VHAVPQALVLDQARAVIGDIGADVIKTGMLGDTAMIEAVADLLAEVGRPTVIDPVMIAKGGHVLLQPYAVGALLEALAPLAALLTPNAPEAAALTGLKVESTDDLRRAGYQLIERGAVAVLMKGGHIAGDRVIDLLMTPVSETRFESGRLHTRHTHGTGCTLASACAAGLAQGQSLEAAVSRAHAYVQEAIRRAPGFGQGHGPLDHAWPMRDGGL